MAIFQTSRSLKSKWLATLFVAMLLVSLALAGLAWWTANQISRWQAEQRLQTIVAMIARPNYPLSLPVLRSIASLSDAKIVLLDRQGTIVASSHEPLVHQSIQLPVLTDPSQSTRTDHHWIGPDQVRYHAIWKPFEPVDAPQRWTAKWIGVWLPDSAVQSTRQQAILLPLITGLTATFVIGAVAYWLTSRIVSRISHVRSQVQQIAQGNFQVPTSLHPDDELGTLSQGIQSMASALQAMQVRILENERQKLLHGMAQGLSHDLRNTLTGARLAIQLHARKAAREQPSLAVALRQLELAEEQLKRFMRLDELSATDAPLRLQSIVDDVVDWLQPRIEHAHSQLHVDLSPAASTQMLTQADWIRSAILNLLTNAIQAAGNHGTIRLSAFIQESHLHIAVRDNGPGPSADIATSMFEPLVTTKAEGVGLGLTLVAKAADILHGEVGWQRVENQTEFFLILPLEKD